MNERARQWPRWLSIHHILYQCKRQHRGEIAEPLNLHPIVLLSHLQKLSSVKRAEFQQTMARLPPEIIGSTWQ
eukprot:5204921-Amphidinium_carterae.1